MGGAISSIFGGGYSEPETPEIKQQPIPEQEKEPVSQAVRDAERRKLAARRGMSGTILTSPLGTTGQRSGSLGILGGQK
ncbi:MAG: hypothetical protein HDQ93_06715 [Desulfovibrio sp.]|nr:hypothetical protein [Desulfovibrio sp.]MBD5608524.1 hypothetical protein [Desulfovibrio sp.]